MASTQILQHRIKSVRSTRQITKSMELVAASKMRRATEGAQQGRAYRQAAQDLLERMSRQTDINEHPLYKRRKIQSRLYIVITSDHGLAGAYNSNIIKSLTRSAGQDSMNGIKAKAIIIGNRGVQFIKHIDDIELVAAFPSFGDNPTANDIRPILTILLDLFNTQEVDEVCLLYTYLQSTILQLATAITLLPAQSVQDQSVENSVSNDIAFEPSINSVLDNVTVRLLEVQIWQSMLESIASEHSMRMLSMKNATDNANDLIGDLTLEYNSVRQAHITQEIAEVTGGAEALRS